MSDRIKQLIEQARKKPLGDSWTYRSPGEFQQALIDAVIEECALVVDRAEPLNTWSKRYSTLIKEHFYGDNII